METLISVNFLGDFFGELKIAHPLSYRENGVDTSKVERLFYKLVFGITILQPVEIQLADLTIS